MSADKQRNKAAIRQREYMEAAKKRVAEQESARSPGAIPIAPPRGPWSAAELLAEVDAQMERFPSDSIPVALVAFRDRAMNLPGYQSAGEPLRSRPVPQSDQPLEHRRGHLIAYVPAMRHFVVVAYDADKRTCVTRCVHETQMSSWEPAAPTVAAKRAAA